VFDVTRLSHLPFEMTRVKTWLATGAAAGVGTALGIAVAEDAGIAPGAAVGTSAGTEVGVGAAVGAGVGTAAGVSAGVPVLTSWAGDEPCADGVPANNIKSEKVHNTKNREYFTKNLGVISRCIKPMR
jgi:hypothetical protein